MDKPAGSSVAPAMGLRYVADDLPGYSRRRCGRGFVYLDPDGRPLLDQAERARSRALAIPPAWRNVWISPWPDGHLLATGRDDKNRKQYIYHPEWLQHRDEVKFERMLEFGRRLHLIRARVDRDMRHRTLVKPRVVATIVRLLECSLIRVGNEQYARTNRSFGLTTLRKRHVDIERDRIRFRFVGKGGKPVMLKLTDRRLARTIARLQELPGQEVFQYLDDDGTCRAVRSDDVNGYLREVAKEDFSAKDFRTFAATVLAAWALAAFDAVESKAAAKRNITGAIKQVAARLGNTPTVCRQSYVHPEILAAYLDGTLINLLQGEIDRELRHSLRHLEPDEAAVLALLHCRLAKARHRR